MMNISMFLSFDIVYFLKHLRDYQNFIDSLILREYYYLLRFLRGNKILEARYIFDYCNLSFYINKSALFIEKKTFIGYLKTDSKFSLSLPCVFETIFNDDKNSEMLRDFNSILDIHFENNNNHYIILKFNLLVALYSLVFRCLNQDLPLSSSSLKNEKWMAHELCLFYLQEILNYAIENKIKHINFLEYSQYLKEETIENIVFNLEKLT